ncbi:MAG: DUF1015 domain-containing protein [Planctomycetota bacterium]
MPNIQAFRGVRYDLGRVGGLSAVVAPPYDVIDAGLQQRLLDRHPHNIVRLILGADSPADTEQDNRYTRAARLLRQWRRDGVLFTEGDPAVYACHQTFCIDGVEHTRRGVLCRVQLERWAEPGDGAEPNTAGIYPHEETHGRAKADRLKLWRACRANLSPIFGLYPDDDNGAQSLLESAIAGVTPLEATEAGPEDGVGAGSDATTTRLWPVTDVQVINRLQAALGAKPLYIADGHHRYETACDYRDELARQQGGPLPAGHAAASVLAMCVSMSDPGMVVQPTHRLLRGAPEMTAEGLIEKLGGCFSCESAGTGPERAQDVWELVAAEGDQRMIGLYTAADQRWTLCRLQAEGEQRMARLAPERSAEWRGLGVSLLHRLVADDLLGVPPGVAPKYVRSIPEVVAGLIQGDGAGRDLTGQQATGGRFNLAAIVMPATLDHIRRLAALGERMPAKSTYFYPKVPSGLVINPLE